jgi:hypothetical protein
MINVIYFISQCKHTVYFEVVTVVSVRIRVIRVLTPCSLERGFQHFGRKCYFYLQGRRDQGEEVARELLNIRNNFITVQ